MCKRGTKVIWVPEITWVTRVTEVTLGTKVIRVTEVTWVTKVTERTWVAT